MGKVFLIPGLSSAMMENTPVLSAFIKKNLDFIQTCHTITSIMEHTYIFSEGSWVAHGTYFGMDGKPVPLEGISRIIHSATLWRNDSTMKILQPSPVEYLNVYEIQPFHDKDWTTWRSHHPALGYLKGKFMVVGECILSGYSSENGLYSGTETLIQISPSQYRSWGMSFKSGEKLSSWMSILTKKS